MGSSPVCWSPSSTWRTGGRWPTGPTPLRVAMTVDEMRAASFRIRYALHDGPGDDDPVAIEAWTRMAIYDLEAGRPRRLDPAERAFLGRWSP